MSIHDHFNEMLQMYKDDYEMEEQMIKWTEMFGEMFGKKH
jgi:hypothetical protein